MSNLIAVYLEIEMNPINYNIWKVEQNDQNEFKFSPTSLSSSSQWKIATAKLCKIIAFDRNTFISSVNVIGKKVKWVYGHFQVNCDWYFNWVILFKDYGD